LQETGQRLLALKFDNPTQDQQIIRAHAYLTGKFEQLKQLFEDVYPDPEQVNDPQHNQQED
jgi:hypothetical protein